MIVELEIPGPLLIEPKRFGDERGFFMETYSRKALADAGVDVEFVQDNHSRSDAVGTMRGLHFQTPPNAQVKLVRVVAGAVLDVAVDIRVGSPTYGRHVAAELSAENGRQLLVPVGFAHGFLTLTPGAEVLYKVSDYYAPQAEGGLQWSDPEIGIVWPTPTSGHVVNDRDRAWPRLSAFTSPFV